MAAKIRLQRKGSKNAPFYRIVVTDVRQARGGKIIELLGTYNPVKSADAVDIDEDKTTQWLQKGAQMTVTTKNILQRKGLLKTTAV